MSYAQEQLAWLTFAENASRAGVDREFIVLAEDHSVIVRDGANNGGASRLAENLVEPQGRLTLASLTPVLIGNVSGATTIYYTPYVGSYGLVSSGQIFNSSRILWRQPFFTELSLALDSNAGHTNYHAAASLFDVFLFYDGTTLRIGTGPAWTSLTNRGTGAGTTELGGFGTAALTNSNSITLRWGNGAGNTVAVAAGMATYLGTFYTTAAGQTSFEPSKTDAAGGAAAFIGLWNAFNRVLVHARSRDNGTQWAANTLSTWEPLHNNSNNRISWVDGLQRSYVRARLSARALTVATSDMAIGVIADATTGTPSNFGRAVIDQTVAGATLLSTMTSEGFFAPLLGLHYAQAMEFADNAGNTFGKTGVGQDADLRLSLMM